MQAKTKVSVTSAGWQAKGTTSLQDVLIQQREGSSNSLEMDEEELGSPAEFIRASNESAEPLWIIIEGFDGTTISGVTLWCNARIVEVWLVSD
jgi:hypothetical protein